MKTKAMRRKLVSIARREMEPSRCDKPLNRKERRLATRAESRLAHLACMGFVTDKQLKGVK